MHIYSTLANRHKHSLDLVSSSCGLALKLFN